MLQAHFTFHPLLFKSPAGTSRGVLNSRETWFVFINNKDNPGVTGVGECGLIPGLSPDSRKDIVRELEIVCRDIHFHSTWMAKRGHLFPAIKFAIETALADLNNGGKRIFAESSFTRGEDGIPINGLIWMGDRQFMGQQVRQKLDEGYQCIKIKIGAIAFEDELNLIRSIREEFDEHTIQIRVDANGAFSAAQAPVYLQRLSEYGIHSIEQPIRQGQWDQMASLCRNAAIPVALDEELIGIYGEENKRKLLETIRPQYIILKPGLLGGLLETENWIQTANELNIGWWVTSALESNIGLNAIAQWTFSHYSGMTQGLGTGQLYSNNIPSPLFISNGHLFHDASKSWDLKSPGHES